MSRPAFLLSEEEFMALFNEPHELLKVYCAVRQVMNYTTGIAGLPPYRLSEQMIREVLHVDAVRGRHTADMKPLTRQRVRQPIQRLVELGLLEPMPEMGAMVYRLPQAVMDTSARTMSNRSATNEQPYQQPYQQPSKSPVEQVTCPTPATTSATTATTDDALMSNPQPEAVISTTTSSRAKPKKRIADDWQPSERCLALARFAGVPESFCKALVGEFVLYWQERGDSRPGWDSTFLSHCKRQWGYRPHPALPPNETDTEGAPHHAPRQSHVRPGPDVQSGSKPYDQCVSAEISMFRRLGIPHPADPGSADGGGAVLEGSATHH